MQPRPAERITGRDSRGGISVRDVLKDRRVLRQHFAIVHLEHGHESERMDRAEIGAVFSALRLRVDLDIRRVRARLVE